MQKVTEGPECKSPIFIRYQIIFLLDFSYKIQNAANFIYWPMGERRGQIKRGWSFEHSAHDFAILILLVTNLTTGLKEKRDLKENQSRDIKLLRNALLRYLFIYFKCKYYIFINYATKNGHPTKDIYTVQT